MSFANDDLTWEAILAPFNPARECYGILKVAVVTYLEQHRGAPPLSTIDLVEAIYSGENDQTDQRIFSGLKAMAFVELRDYWDHGPEKTYMGRTMKPKLWRAPPAKTCPHCGGVL